VRWSGGILTVVLLVVLARHSAAIEAWLGAGLARCGERPLELALLLAGATLVSEDLACLGAGALVARGALSFGLGTAACFVGIFVGDVLLFLCGRWLGPALLKRAPARWFVAPQRIAEARAWLERRGPVVILLSRFLPGARLPTYFASGALGTRLGTFSLWFALAGLLWTPLLVGASAGVGQLAFVRQGGVTRALACVVGGVLLVALSKRLAPWRARAQLRAHARRWTRFEYWPMGLFYLPVFALVLARALRGQGTHFTAANPALPLGGFVGESKRAIYELLAEARAPLPRMVFLPAGGGARREIVRGWLGPEGPGFPLVVKPDVGQRGDGVRIVRDEGELGAVLRVAEEPLVVQEFVPGDEYGLFCARETPAGPARLLSITKKVLPVVVGDGRNTLERLILLHREHRAMAPLFLRRTSTELARIPAAGERVTLGELGTHCRGARFLDGRELATPALAAELTRLVTRLDGFCIGRFDVRAASEDELCAGRFVILELNGVTAEAAHIYDPKIGLLEAWRTLLDQWRRAYELGVENARRGARVSTFGELTAAIRGYRALDARRRTCGTENAAARPLEAGA
jgi:membrane protein DedA with SNARE-associated domain